MNKVSSNGIKLLIEGLLNCKSLMTLSLSQCSIQDSAIQYIGELIISNPSLKDLELSRNPISKAGMEILSQYMVGNTSLSSIDLSGNQKLSPDSIPLLIDIAEKSCILEINILSTPVPFQDRDNLFKALEVPIDKRDIPVFSSSKSAAKGNY